jgi:hypothetical protein
MKKKRRDEGGTGSPIIGRGTGQFSEEWKACEDCVECAKEEFRAIIYEEVRKKGCLEEVLISKEVGARVVCEIELTRFTSWI